MARVGLTRAAKFTSATTPLAAPLIGYRTVKEFTGWNKTETLLRPAIERWSPHTVLYQILLIRTHAPSRAVRWT